MSATVGQVGTAHPGLVLASMLEQARPGETVAVVALADGSIRSFLLDADEVTITATAPGPSGARIGFGEVTGQILPAS